MGPGDPEAGRAHLRLSQETRLPRGHRHESPSVGVALSPAVKGLGVAHESACLDWTMGWKGTHLVPESMCRDKGLQRESPTVR